jgi:translation initiation factor IF-2
MSRVRIYELAKEAGMSSKALADKLVEAGYDIKGHSSTVDEETAARIRQTVLQGSDTEMVEKRISGNQGSTVIRRRSTVIRRKAKPVAEEEEVAEMSAAEVPDIGEEAAEVPEEKAEAAPEEKQVEEQPEAEKAETVAESQEKPATPRAEGVAKVISRPPAGKVVEAESAAPEKVEQKEEQPVAGEEQKGETEEVAAPVEEEVKSPEPEKAAAEVKEKPAQVKEKPAQVKEKPAPKQEKAEEKPAVEEPAKTAPVAKKKVKPAPQRKGMAKIVGTIELPTEPEPQPTRGRKKPGKSAAPRKARPDQPAPGEVMPQVAADDSGRGKKRGKRGGAEFADENRGRRAGKGGKKGGKNVKFTHFGDDYHRGHGKRGKRGKGAKERQVQPAAEMKASKRRIVVYETISVSELASRMRVKASEVIAKLMGLGVMATINQAVDVDTAMLIASDFGYEVEQGITEEIGIQMLEEAQEGGEAEARSPVVTVMGHVDHGKTSILDAIRKTDVAEGEAGGITQHIGAYHVRSSAGDVTFVDTPGHAAFTEMRSRGAQVTDLVILVVAADDGVMGQTREAINHAQAAEVPILVAVNKIDKDNADPDRVKRELADYDLIPEEWGGQTIFVETSAKQNIGIDDLMESIMLMAEILELKADRKRNAKGRVIEAKLDKGRGAVATVLVQEGTLKGGDNFVVGMYAGKVRAMLDDRGRTIKSAGPSIPVEVQGLSGVPQAGDEFIVVTDEKMAKNVSQVRAMKAREAELGANSKISLDKLFEKMSEGEVQELRVILRADVQGTLEAFAKAAEELSTKDIKVRVLHEGTGTITESDILLASASEAIIIGFNVRPTVKVKELATKENVDVRSYDVIYHALDDIRKAMVGMLEPTYKEDVIGTAEVRETFSVPKVGVIAGCGVMDGKIQRNAGVRVLREGVVVYTGKISSLKRFKDDVKEVASGYECGIGVENFNDIKVGDHLEAFVMLEVEATLE